MSDSDASEGILRGLPVADNSASFVHNRDIDVVADLPSSDSDSDLAIDYTEPLDATATTSPSDIARRKSIVKNAERDDYKSLVESLRTIDQHDTARHLMNAILAFRQFKNSRTEAGQTLRKRWTAWPVPPTQTIHSHQSRSVLRAEMISIVHAEIYKRLRRMNVDISADDLPPILQDAVADSLLSNFEALLDSICQTRTHQGGKALSRTFSHRSVISLLESKRIISASRLARLKGRCRTLFTEDMPEELCSIDSQSCL